MKQLDILIEKLFEHEFYALSEELAHIRKTRDGIDILIVLLGQFRSKEN